MREILSILALVLIFSADCWGQESNNPPDMNFLQTEIMKMDSLLFDVAFNTCDLPLFKQIVSKDLEFYDDRSGLNTSIDKEIMAFKDRCSKPFTVTRQLISSEVHKLGNYGALQTGKHAFYVAGKKVEEAKFSTIWQKTENSWIMKRAISYDHKGITNQ